MIQRLRELAIDGVAPTKDRWNEQRGAELPSAYSIVADGHAWAALVQQAGLRQAKPGNKLGSTKGFTERPVPEETEAYIRHAFATSEPPRPSTWPLFGIPTRTETFRGRLPDGRPVQVTRQYYSLR